MTTELPPDLPHRRTPVADARALIVAALTPLPTEPVALADLAGRVVGAPVIAPHDLPRHANSAMDGFAVAAGTPSPWPLSAHILAGDDPAPLVPGTAAAIATGGVVPEGADAVIPLERVQEADDVITALAPVIVIVIVTIITISNSPHIIIIATTTISNFSTDTSTLTIKISIIIITTTFNTTSHSQPFNIITLVIIKFK
jgi:hypothetical protein